MKPALYYSSLYGCIPEHMKPNLVDSERLRGLWQEDFVTVELPWNKVLAKSLYLKASL